VNREKSYAQIAQRSIPNDPFWQKYHQHRFRTFNALVPAEPRRVLDFGCGTAENVVLLSGLGHDVVGIDPVPEMIELGRERLREGGVDAARVEVGGLDWMRRCPPGRFDAVSALNVLPYLSEPEEAEFYAEARRLTGPGGVMVASHTYVLGDLVTFNRYTVEFWRDRIVPSLADDPGERDELLAALAGHLTRPEVPVRDGGHRSERDFLMKRRINPLEYPGILAERHRVRVEATAFTHFYPMPRSSWSRALASGTGSSSSRRGWARARRGTSSPRSSSSGAAGPRPC
jgi:SAM-dependent methyltransferase